MFAHFSLPNVPDVARRTVVDGPDRRGGRAGRLRLLRAAAPGRRRLHRPGPRHPQFPDDRQLGGKGSARQEENKRRPLALNTLGRMGIITVVTIGLLFVSTSLGFGVLGGLAVFQVVLLANVARSMAKAGPMTSVDDVINANVVEDNIVRNDPHPALHPPDESRGGE